MPVNKNAYLRYQVLDECLSNFHRKYYFEDLLDAVNEALREKGLKGIGRTQLFKDLQTLEYEFGAEIDRIPDGRKKYYRYHDKDFSIKNVPLMPHEAESIRRALSVINRFKGMPQFEWVEELLPVLQNKLGADTTNKQIIFFDTNIDYAGLKNIEPLFNAIQSKRVLEIEYRDFKSDKPYKITFHPYILKQYNGRWFVIGLNEEKDYPFWNLALDRILSIKETGKPYKTYDIDWEDDYFYDIIGVSRPLNAVPEEIILEISPDLYPYIETKPIHPTQRVIKTLPDGTKHVLIKAIPNYELESKILSFGEGIVVLEPYTLRNKIKNRVHLMREKYF